MCDARAGLLARPPAGPVARRVCVEPAPALTPFCPPWLPCADPDARQLLGVYNRAWGQALVAQGFTLDTRASQFVAVKVGGAGRGRGRGLVGQLVGRRHGACPLAATAASHGARRAACPVSCVMLAPQQPTLHGNPPPLPPHPQRNVTGLAQPPFYFSGTPPPGGNLFTNTSISFAGDRWLSQSELDGILNTPEVEGSIAQGLAALGEWGEAPGRGPPGVVGGAAGGPALGWCGVPRPCSGLAGSAPRACLTSGK